MKRRSFTALLLGLGALPQIIVRPQEKLPEPQAEARLPKTIEEYLKQESERLTEEFRDLWEGRSLEAYKREAARFEQQGPCSFPPGE